MDAKTSPSTLAAANATALAYLSGIGNHHASEAVPGTLPIGRNSPQRAAHGLYAELISGSAFTAARAQNQRTWVYRRQPSVAGGAFHPLPHELLKSGAAEGEQSPPDPLRWHPVEIPAAPLDFVQGLRTLAVNGDPDHHQGMAAHTYVANQPMGRQALMNADGEMLIVPQQGTLRITTELGRLDVAPGQIALVPRGLYFKVDVDGPSRGYICENYGAAFRLPELGPIGSNGLANARDFQAPVAWYEDEPGAYRIVMKSGGKLWQAQRSHSPFNVVAWHGSLTPYRYDTAHFNTIGSISFDHPDPSIFTVLTSPSDTPGWANVDFVIFPPRWLVGEDTFRPPWYHRNVMSEFMGLVLGQYDAKPEGFRPGGASLHNAFVPHGPDLEAFDKASQAELKPHKLDNTLAFMFETRYRLRPTAHALDPAGLDQGYAHCWDGLADHFAPPTTDSSSA